MTDPRQAGRTVAPTVAVGDPNGSYRRAILVRTIDARAAAADLEDDFHRFGVVLHHDGRRIERLETTATRSPWSTCAHAGAVLTELVGAPLQPRFTAIAQHSDPRANCTHLFDLAGLAAAHVARSAPDRRYDIELTAVRGGRQQAFLALDGTRRHTWTIACTPTARTLLDPPPFTEAPWRGGFLRWAETHLEPAEAEAAIVLRRACDIGMGRAMALEDFTTAAELGDLMAGVCFTMQPERMAGAERRLGEIRDFAQVPEALLADLDGLADFDGVDDAAR